MKLHVEKRSCFIIFGEKGLDKGRAGDDASCSGGVIMDVIMFAVWMVIISASADQQYVFGCCLNSSRCRVKRV